MKIQEKKSFSIGYGKVEQVNIGYKLPLVFFGGPCAIESRDHAFKMADKIASIAKGWAFHGYINLAMIRIVGHRRPVFTDWV